MQQEVLFTEGEQIMECLEADEAVSTDEPDSENSDENDARAGAGLLRQEPKNQR